MSVNTYFQELVEGKIDFAGQQLVDQISRIALITVTFISFVLGFALQSLTVTFELFGASTILIALIVIPPWPIFNRHPVEWLPVIDDQDKKDR